MRSGPTQWPLELGQVARFKLSILWVCSCTMWWLVFAPSLLSLWVGSPPTPTLVYIERDCDLLLTGGGVGTRVIESARKKKKNRSKQEGGSVHMQITSVSPCKSLFLQGTVTHRLLIGRGFYVIQRPTAQCPELPVMVWIRMVLGLNSGWIRIARAGSWTEHINLLSKESEKEWLSVGI